MLKDYSNIPLGITLHPSTEQFSDFRNYVNTLEADPALADHGIVKVIVTRSGHLLLFLES